MKRSNRLLCLLLAVMLLLGLTACGKDSGTDVTGKYLCIAIAEDGVNFTAPEDNQQYVELKKGGKGEIYTNLAFDMTWELDSGNFTGNYKIFGIDAPITGTLKDNVLEIHDDDVVMRYLKEGAEMPDWAEDVAAAPEKGRLAGMYTLYAMEAAGEHYDYAALVEKDMMDDSYLRIDYDTAAGYTGELYLDGEEPAAFTLEDELGTLNFPNGRQMGFSEEAPGVIGIMQEEPGGTIFFALESVAREDTAGTEPTNISGPLADWWNGDWYGCWNMYGCKGSYEDIEVKYWDCEAHIDIDASTCTGTMELWDDEQYQNMGGIGLVDVSLSENGTGEHGTLMSEGGWFEKMTLAHADWIIDPALSDYENMITITGDYDDGEGNSYSFKMTLRHWGELWEDVDEGARPCSYEDWYKPMIKDGVTKMSVRFGDPDPSVYEGLTSGQKEDGEGSGTGTTSAGYGRSNAAATGEVSLETLKSGWETIRNSDNKYDLLYEDVRDLMGCDGEPFDIDGMKNAYCWQSGSAILTVTFKVLDDGNEELNAIAVTGLD